MTKKVIVTSHRRSGTHLTIDSIVNNFDTFKDNPPISQVTLDHLALHVSQWNLTPKELDNRISDISCVLKTHAHGNILDFFAGEEERIEYAERLFNESKIIYVHRDGRDVMVSQYHYQKQFDNVTREQSLSDYIRAKNNFDSSTYEGHFNRVEYWAFHVNSWISRGNYLLVSFGELQTEYYATLQKISEFIDEPLNKQSIDIRISSRKQYGIIDKLKQRLFNKGIKRSSVSFRKGKSGDWKEYFSNEDIEFFDTNSGKLNQKLGYI